MQHNKIVFFYIPSKLIIEEVESVEQVSIWSDVAHYQ